MGIFAYFCLPQHVVLIVVPCKYTSLGEITCQPGKPGGILCCLKGTALFEKTPIFWNRWAVWGPLEKEEVEQQLWDG